MGIGCLSRSKTYYQKALIDLFDLLVDDFLNVAMHDYELDIN